ncbi:MAG: TRM11 family SAM-dependent methyltransferase [Natronosporangium sp.]
MPDPRDTHISADSAGNCALESPATLIGSSLRLSVILVGQRSLAAQRRGRYVAGSGAQPARMAPDLATALIAEYTQPGDWVLDPLAEVGTTLVEATHLGRNAYGVEIEAGWVALARANIAHARRQGATGCARVRRGDATRLRRGVPAGLRGRFALVVTSPPYGKTMHGRVEHRRRTLTRFRNSYGDTRSNLAHQGRSGLVDGVTAVLAGCVPLLRPGGVVAVVSRPWRRDRHWSTCPTRSSTRASPAGCGSHRTAVPATPPPARAGCWPGAPSSKSTSPSAPGRRESRPVCPNTTSLPSSSGQSSLRVPGKRRHIPVTGGGA